jgi:hypothetical protein
VYLSSSSLNCGEPDEENENENVEDSEGHDEICNAESRVGVSYDDVTALCLPDLCLEKIISDTLQTDLSSRSRLRSVCKYFKQTVDSHEKHRLYLNQLSCGQLSLEYGPVFSGTACVSVNRLVRAAGKGSSVITELCKKFKNPHWFSSWLVLGNCGFGWFSVEKIFWK